MHLVEGNVVGNVVGMWPGTGTREQPNTHIAAGATRRVIVSLPMSVWY